MRGLSPGDVVIASRDGYRAKEFLAKELEAAVRQGAALEATTVHPLGTVTHRPPQSQFFENLLYSFKFANNKAMPSPFWQFRGYVRVPQKRGWAKGAEGVCARTVPKRGSILASDGYPR